MVTNPPPATHEARLHEAFDKLHQWLDELGSDDNDLKIILIIKINELLKRIKYKENDNSN